MASTASGGGGLGRRRAKDAGMAAMMKAKGILRTTQRCALCYRTVGRETPISNYNHVCPGGR